MLDKCYFCKADVVQQYVTIDYRWGDTLVIIKDVQGRTILKKLI